MELIVFVLSTAVAHHEKVTAIYTQVSISCHASCQCIREGHYTVTSSLFLSLVGRDRNVML